MSARFRRLQRLQLFDRAVWNAGAATESVEVMELKEVARRGGGGGERETDNGQIQLAPILLVPRGSERRSDVAEVAS
ncbi:MAG: hypothetical protein ABSG53_02750 [Thermoguttaceae bacterium]